MRIVKAQQEERHNKVKVLQRLLKHSFSAKLLTVKKVTENKGKKTPGIDGVLWHSRHINAKETFSYVDYHIYQAIQQWCYRRHPKKGKWWVNKRYFHHSGKRNWIFAVKTSDGNLKELLRAADTPIIRYTKIKKEANPYAPEWAQYFKNVKVTGGSLYTQTAITRFIPSLKAVPADST